MARGRTERGLEALADEVYSVMRRAGFRAEIIGYPSGRRTIDVVSGRRESRILIRVVDDAATVTRGDAEELRKAAAAYEATPLIVARSINGYEAEEDVVYDKQGLNVIGFEVLEQYFLRGEKPLIYNIRGHYCVKINREKLREKRLAMNMSLGEAARLLGITRRTVYLYEHGLEHVSIETAERIVEVFGEDVIEPIDVAEPVHGAERTYYLKRTPVDAVARLRDAVLSIVVGSGNKRRIRAKLEESEKMAGVMGSKRIIVENLEDMRRVIKHYLSKRSQRG